LEDLLNKIQLADPFQKQFPSTELHSKRE